jgi:hypothetical protein
MNGSPADNKRNLIGYPIRLPASREIIEKVGFPRPKYPMPYFIREALFHCGLMVAGTIFLVYEEHEHDHVHEAIQHEHSHTHDDEHHSHVHGESESYTRSHSHIHEHTFTEHEHHHMPDTHHRHTHPSRT